MTAATTIVTGATGFVGGHLLDHLGDSAAPVVGWHRPGGSGADTTRHIAWQPVDLIDETAVKTAVRDSSPARVFHLGGLASVDSSFKNAVPHLRANALGTHHLLEAVRQLQAPCRVLVITSGQVYQASDEPIAEQAPLAPASPYGVSKLAQDQIAMAAAADGLDVVVARPFNHIGPRQEARFAVASFARQIARIEAGLEPPTLQVGNLDTRRDVTDVRDVVDAYVRLMQGGTTGRAYNVCSGRAWRIGDLLEELCHLARTRVVVETDPSRLRPGDVSVIQGDATRLRTELGWTPRIPVEQTLRDTLDWWREQVSAGRG